MGNTFNVSVAWRVGERLTNVVNVTVGVGVGGGVIVSVIDALNDSDLLGS